MKSRALHRLALARRASTTVEFALVGFGVMLSLMVILNLGLLGFQLESVARGVQAAARQAAVGAAAKAANTGTFICPTPAAIAGYFSTYTSSALPAAGIGTGANPLIAATWANNSGSATEVGLNVTVSATYNWQPFGGFFTYAIPLKIATLATVTGTLPNTGAGYTPSIDTGTCGGQD